MEKAGPAEPEANLRNSHTCNVKVLRFARALLHPKAVSAVWRPSGAAAAQWRQLRLPLQLLLLLLLLLPLPLLLLLLLLPLVALLVLAVSFPGTMFDVNVHLCEDWLGLRWGGLVTCAHSLSLLPDPARRRGGVGGGWSQAFFSQTCSQILQPTQAFRESFFLLARQKLRLPSGAQLGDLFRAAQADSRPKEMSDQQQSFLTSILAILLQLDCLLGEGHIPDD